MNIRADSGPPVTPLFRYRKWSYTFNSYDVRFLSDIKKIIPVKSLFYHSRNRFFTTSSPTSIPATTVKGRKPASPLTDGSRTAFTVVT